MSFNLKQESETYKFKMVYFSISHATKNATTQYV
jgi:hypothetical protein